LTIGLTPLPHVDAHQEQISLMALTHTRPAFNYGVFNGKRWEAQIYPVVRNMIQSVT
jgi:poly-beta-hydroxyalkanoate depolymerase